ncbi:MAG: hypothetical protein V1821_01480 [bacterium]
MFFEEDSSKAKTKDKFKELVEKLDPEAAEAAASVVSDSPRQDESLESLIETILDNLDGVAEPGVEQPETPEEQWEDEPDIEAEAPEVIIQSGSDNPLGELAIPEVVGSNDDQSDRTDAVSDFLDELLEQLEELETPKQGAAVMETQSEDLLSDQDETLDQESDLNPFAGLLKAVEPEESLAPTVEVESEISKLKLARKALEQTREMLSGVVELLDAEIQEKMGDLPMHRVFSPVGYQRSVKSVEGVFDGERMVAANGSIYEVPANYASKSRLVEGDLLKVTTFSDGTHRFKQIGPAPRERVVGLLIGDLNSNCYHILAGGDRFKLLNSSVAYYRGRPGDEVVALVPKGMPSRFAAVEMIVHKS